MTRERGPTQRVTLRTTTTVRAVAVLLATLVAASTAAGAVGAAGATGATADAPANFRVSVEHVEVGDVPRDPPFETVSVTQGQPFNMWVVIENTGGRTATQEVSFTYDGFAVESSEITLAAGERTYRRHYGLGTNGLEIGTHELAVSTANDSETVRLVIEDPASNVPPTADAGPDRTVEEGEFTLDATGSSDPDGSVVSYEWRPVNTHPARFFDAETATPRVVALVGGERAGFTFELTVTDDDGATDTDRVTVTVTDVGAFHRLRVEGSGTRSAYAFAVSGSVLRGGDAYDSVARSTVDGAVTGWSDAYEFVGDLDALTVDGDAAVSLDGERVDPADYGDGHTLRVEGDGAYQFAVSDRVVAGGDERDVVSDSFASGAVHGWTDAYHFTGDLDALSVSGDATVYLDGEEVDPADYDPVHRLDVAGTGPTSTYEFTVSGAVFAGPSFDPSADSVSGSAAAGSVSGWDDAYYFTGEVESLTADDGVTVLLDGDPWDGDNSTRLAPAAPPR